MAATPRRSARKTRWRRNARPRDALTLAALVNDWEALHLKSKRPSYAIDATRAIRRAFRKYLDLPAADLDRATAVRALDKIVKEGSPVMAARTGAYLCACYEWAVKRGTLTGNPFAKLPRPETPSRERTLTDVEIAAVWKAAESAGVFGAVVRMLILTGQRRDEVASATWSELSPDLRAWTIPGSRTKNGATHIVSMSRQAQAIIAGQPRLNDNPHVFAGLNSGAFRGFSRSKVALDRTSGIKGWTLHDLRRTVATGLQKLGVRLEVTEAVLNHVSGSRAGIVGVYQRHSWSDEKRAALNAWGAHVEAIVYGRDSGGNIVEFARG
jgi:integrase